MRELDPKPVESRIDECLAQEDKPIVYKQEKDYLHSLISPILKAVKRRYSQVSKIELQLTKDSENKSFIFLDICKTKN